MIIYMKNCLWLTIILISIIYVSCERNSIIDVDYVRAEKPNNVVSVDIDTTFMCEFPEISDALDIQVIRDSIIIVHDKVSDANIFHFKVRLLLESLMPSMFKNQYIAEILLYQKNMICCLRL